MLIFPRLQCRLKCPHRSKEIKSDHSRSNYPRLKESDQCSVFLLLGQLACVSPSSTERWSSGDRADQLELATFTNLCAFCDGRLGLRPDPALLDESVSGHLFTTFSALLQLLQTPRRKQPRVAAMVALKRLLTHTTNTDHHNLAQSIYGQWCLQALRASARDLRIAAGFAYHEAASLHFKLMVPRRSLPVFLQISIGRGILQNNCRVLLESLRALSADSDTMLQETCILAWGQIAR